MVYSISYEPSGSSYPLAEIVEGNRGEVELEDMTPDGGVGLQISRSFSGRRVKPESVPKKIKWCSRRKLQDFETVFIKTVSFRFRELIEKIEPDVHQFLPVEFVDKGGSHLEDRWFWQVCNRIDSVHRGETNWTLKEGVIWSPPKHEKPRLVFDLSRIGNKKFWHDKHRSSLTLTTDETRTRMGMECVSGLRFHHYEQS